MCARHRRTLVDGATPAWDSHASLREEFSSGFHAIALDFAALFR